jgi:hypothetical protein
VGEQEKWGELRLKHDFRVVKTTTLCSHGIKDHPAQPSAFLATYSCLR